MKNNHFSVLLECIYVDNYLSESITNVHAYFVYNRLLLNRFYEMKKTGGKTKVCSPILIVVHVCASIVY